MKSAALIIKLGIFGILTVPFRLYFEPSELKKENVNNYKFWDIAEDRNHFGSSWTSYLSNKFFEAVNDKIN